MSCSRDNLQHRLQPCLVIGRFETLAVFYPIWLISSSYKQDDRRIIRGDVTSHAGLAHKSDLLRGLTPEKLVKRTRRLIPTFLCGNGIMMKIRRTIHSEAELNPARILEMTPNGSF